LAEAAQALLKAANILLGGHRRKSLKIILLELLLPFRFVPVEDFIR
jgi:hypothetical protein